VGESPSAQSPDSESSSSEVAPADTTEPEYSGTGSATPSAEGGMDNEAGEEESTSEMAPPPLPLPFMSPHAASTTEISSILTTAIRILSTGLLLLVRACIVGRVAVQEPIPR